MPRDRIVVVTGPSGSGKSSLAFDTIYAEAQRRYVESLSVYARQFLGQMPKPDVDGIDGLSPAISVRQQSTRRSPRSTVGTLTEIHDYLRLLFARSGVAHSPTTGKELRSYSVQQAVDRVMALPEESRLTIAAPIVQGDAAVLEKELARLRKEGFVRVSVDGVVHDLGGEVPLDKKRVQRLEVHVDRVRVKASARGRVAEATELAYKLSGGLAHFVVEDGLDWLASEQLMCLDTGERYAELTPRTFSFNSPEGACPACGGLGVVHEFVADLVVPDAALSLREGAIAPWGRADGAFYQRELESMLSALKVDADKPWSKLTAAQRESVLYGATSEKKAKKDWEGVIPGLKRRETDWVRKKQGRADDVAEALSYLEEEFQRYARESVCAACGGSRLMPLARHVTVHEKTLPTLSEMPLHELHAFVQELESLSREQLVLSRVLRDVASRVTALVDLGLGYLSLSRSAATLSGGELERIRLATQIGSGLVSVLYVLDEPSAGLHARDNERLIKSLQRLRDQGNTVLVVEHDEATIQAADYVVHLGPACKVVA